MEGNEEADHKLSGKEYLLTKLESKGTFDLSLVQKCLAEGYIGKLEDECVHFAPDDEYGDWSLKLAYYAVRFGNIEVARFLSGFNLELERKNRSGATLLHLAAGMNATNTVAALLRLPWPEAKLHGVKKEQKAALRSLDGESNSVLMLATRQNNVEYVSFLLKYGASTWDINDKEERAVDVAISNHFYDCAILLLEHDSPLPKACPDAIASEKLSSILSARRKLHEFIKIGNLEGIQDLVTNSEFKVVPDENGDSALLTSVRQGKYELFSFLHMNGLRFKSEQEEDLLTGNDRNKIKESNKRLAWEVKDAHIIGILSKCSSLQNVEFAKDIEDCLRDLSSIDEISPILKAVRFSQHVTICFDFENDTLGSLALCSGAKGWFLPKEHELLMGALELKTDRRTFLGTFVHELTHWAMHTIYKNRARPFPADHLTRAREFDNVVQETAKCTHLNTIIKGVFRQYEGNKWDSELIVRVPEMMVILGVEKAVEVLSSQQPTKALLSYYTEYVLTDLKAFILEGNSVKSRETIANLNNEIGTLKLYLESVIRFKPEVLTKYHTQLFGSSSSMVVVTSTYPQLAFLKTCEALNLEHFGAKFNGNILFCEFSELQKRGSEIVSTFYYLNECKYLVMLCAEVTNRAYYIEALKLLSRYIHEKPEKRVILIVNKGVTQLTQREVQITSRSIVCFNEDGLTLADLTAKSQEDILSAELHFQRCKTQMAHVLSDDVIHLVDGAVIETIMRSWGITMENERSSFNDYPPGFVSLYQPISLNRIIEIIDECCSIRSESEPTDCFPTLLIIEGELKCYPTGLREKLSEIFEVHDLSEKFTNYEDGIPASLPIPIILYAPGSNIDYSLLLSNIQSCCRIHQAYCIKVKTRLKVYCDLLYSPKLFIQRQLTRIPGECQSSVDTTIMPGVEGQNEFIDLIRDSENSLHIISEKAGMGKSRFLNFVYDVLKTNYRAIKISLKDALASLDDLPDCALNVRDALNFISSEAGIQDEFSSNLLNSQLLGKSKYPVFLFFDAMDEITSSASSTILENQTKVVGLLDILKNNTHAKALVVTRPEAEGQLSSLPSSPVYRFIPIPLDSSRQYLSYLCHARMYLICSNDTNYEDVVSSCIDKFIASLEYDFLGNPLHFSMLAEVMFEEIMKATQHSTPLESINQYSIEKLYGDFIEIKYRVCFKEKRNIPVDNRMKKRCEFIFRSVALYYLHYDESFCTEYLMNNELFTKTENGLLIYNYEEVSECFDVGIFTTGAGQVSRQKDFRIEFIHRTFAEYFVAKLFIFWMVNQKIDLSQNLIAQLMTAIRPLNLHNFQFFNDMLPAADIPDETVRAVGVRLGEVNQYALVLRLNSLTIMDLKNVIQFLFRCLRNSSKLAMITNSQMYVGCTIDYQYPLVGAAVHNVQGVIRILLEEGFDPNYTVCDANPWTNSFWEFMPKLLPRIPVLGDEHGIGVMHEIAKNGEVELIKLIVKEWGGKLEVQTEAGSTLMHFAAASGELKLVQYLEQQGLDIFVANKNRFTALHFAVMYGRLEMAKWLRYRGLQVVDRADHGDTLLHIAAKNFHPHVIEWLIDEGINPNSLNDEKATPLMVLSQRNTRREGFHQSLIWENDLKRALKCVEILCRKGADPNIKDVDGVTAVHSVAYRCSLDALITMEKYNANILDKTEGGSTLLHSIATGVGIFRSNSTMTLTLLKWLVSRRCNVDDKGSSDGMTVIHMFLDLLHSERRKLELRAMQESLEWLLDHSKNVNATDSKGRGYLFFAHSNSVQYLLAKGCDVNIRDNTGRTAAHCALDRDLISVFQALFESMLQSNLNQNISQEFIDYIKGTEGKRLPARYETLLEWIVNVTSKN